MSTQASLTTFKPYIHLSEDNRSFVIVAPYKERENVFAILGAAEEPFHIYDYSGIDRTRVKIWRNAGYSLFDSLIFAAMALNFAATHKGNIKSFWSTAPSIHLVEISQFDFGGNASIIFDTENIEDSILATRNILAIGLATKHLRNFTQKINALYMGYYHDQWSQGLSYLKRFDLLSMTTYFLNFFEWRRRRKICQENIAKLQNIYLASVLVAQETDELKASTTTQVDSFLEDAKKDFNDPTLLERWLSLTALVAQTREQTQRLMDEFSDQSPAKKLVNEIWQAAPPETPTCKHK